MSFIDFKAIVKKVNMKPKGLTEITLEVNTADLDGKIQHLSEMIDQKVESQLESTLVIIMLKSILTRTNLQPAIRLISME
ncbi:hypothetical protein [Bacillus haynesii]|uniref:hypothetical protein n=1 Tax=Bacillus haynesii TaxID=1925021 RepID=UPI003B97D58E